MFFVFNKDKIMSYIVTAFTIAVLFITASAFKDNKAIETSTNIVNNEKILNNNVINNTMCE